MKVPLWTMGKQSRSVVSAMQALAAIGVVSETADARAMVHQRADTMEPPAPGSPILSSWIAAELHS